MRIPQQHSTNNLEKMHIADVRVVRTHRCQKNEGELKFAKFTLIDVRRGSVSYVIMHSGKCTYYNNRVGGGGDFLYERMGNV